MYVSKFPTTFLQEKQYSEKSLILQEKLDTTRSEWFEKISELINKTSDMTQINNAQVLMLSYRHQLVDYSSGNLTKALINARTLYDKGKKDSMLESKTNFNFKLSTVDEKNTVIKADIRVLEEMVELLESQLKYVHECIKLLDNMAYTIRNKIDLFKLIE